MPEVAASLPTFGQVLAYVKQQSPALYRWAKRHQDTLEHAYDEAQGSVGSDGWSAEDFELSRVYSALNDYAEWFRERSRPVLIRPCCNKVPFIYPFCNPRC